MAEDYKIELGVKLNTSDLAEQIAKVDDKHKVKIGVNLGVDDIKKRISKYNENANNAKLHLKIKLDTDDLNRQIRALNLGDKGGGKGVAIPVNTQSLENSLKDVKDIIASIHKSLGALDDGKGMKSLLTSVNQIADALGKATDESETLVKSLNVLASKDFGINLGVKLGGANKNPIANNAAYGNYVRGSAIPQLQKQANALMKAIRDEYAKRYSGEYFDFQSDDFILEKLSNRNFYTPVKSIGLLQRELLDDKNLSKQMSSYSEYISVIEDIAKASNIDLSSVASGFSRTKEEIIQGALDIQSGVKNAAENTEEQVEKLKNVFNGGGVDAEGLGKVLKPIIDDLGEIKAALQEFSNIKPFEGLTASLAKFDEVLDKLLSNVNLVKNTLNTELSNASSGNASKNGVEKAVQDQKELAQESKETAEAVNQAFNKISVENVAQEFKEVDIAIGTTESRIGRLSDALRDVGFNDKAIEDITKDFQNLLISVQNVTSRLNNDGSIVLTVKGIDQYERAVKVMKGVTLDRETDKWKVKDLGGTVSQDFKEASAFVKQQKRAVADLTNQINQLNRAANDQNAARPIKNDGYLSTLKTKYDEITKAIEKMETASSDTFVDEQNNVRKLISDFKSLVSEYRNAENIATSLRSKDISTVKDTYTSKLDVLISKMKKDGVYTSGFEKGSENLRSILSNATNASGLTAFLNGLDKLDAGYKRASASVKEFNQSQKVGISVSGLESKIADLQRISPEIDKFETEINDTKVSITSLTDDLGKIKTQGDFTVVNKRFKAFTDAAKAAGIAIAETVKKVKSVDEIKIDIELGTYDNQISQMDEKFGKLTLASKDLRDSVEAVRTAYERMEKALKGTSDETGEITIDKQKLVQAEKEYAAALEKTNNLIRIQARNEKAEANKLKLKDDIKLFQSDIDNWLKNNSAATKRYGATMQNLKAQAEGVDRVTLNGLIRQFKLADKEAERFGLKTLSLGDKLKTQFSKYSAYLGVAEIFMWAEQALRDMFEQVKLIDSAMTELKKVTNETDASYNQFLSNAAKKSKELGTTIDGLVSSTADFARLGYGFKDAQGLAGVANIYAVVGDEINGVEGATESLISTMAAFKGEMNDMSNSDFAMSIVDKFNEIGKLIA